MITFTELKKLIIKQEVEFMTTQLESESELQDYISGIEDEINMCNNIQYLIIWYGNYGWSKEQAYENIIMLLMDKK